VPLAGLAISQTAAKALVIPAPLTALTPGPCSVTPVGSNVSVSGDNCVDVAQGAADPGGLLGVKIYSENSSFEPGSITAFSGSGGTFGLDVIASGGTIGTFFDGSIPVSWDFTVTTSDGGNFSYGLIFEAIGSPGEIVSIMAPSNPSGSTIRGTQAIAPPSGTVTGYSVELTVEESTSCCSKSLTVDVPTNSVDLAPTSGTPEPGSIFLFGGGFAGLLWRRFHRARR
jgi:hypothetical protein